MFVWGLFAFVVSGISTRLIIWLAPKLGLVDQPDQNRKRHAGSIPLMGGKAIYTGILVCVTVLLLTSDLLTGGAISSRHYIGYLLGGAVLMVGGWLDDKYHLPARVTIIAPAIAALVAVGSGIEVSKLTNPFGDVLLIPEWVSHVLVFAWLMVTMYTTKLLDGLDGLSTGVSSVGALMVLLLSLSASYFQPDVALFSSIVLGASLGFLLWNVPPAKVFLGEGGSTFVGYTLGVLAVISGGKLATLALVLGVPMVDVAFVVMRRLKSGGVKRVVKGDRWHLHHRLVDLGWTPTQVLLTYMIAAGVFGASALFLQSREKLIALLMLMTLTLCATGLLVYKEERL